VFLNGLIVYGRDGVQLRNLALDPDVVRNAAAFAAEHGVSLVGCCDERSLCETRDQWTQWLADASDPDPEPSGAWPEIASTQRINKLLLMADPEIVRRIRPLLSERLGDSATLTVSVASMLEVLPPGASKGQGVALLLEHLGIAPEDAMAIGDAENDLGMLRLVGTSVAMGNAPPEVRRAALHGTASNDDDGAALAIERHFLEPQGVRMEY
jgi:Cof subfamily protein (haloacid dehalogenase superfamily)